MGQSLASGFSYDEGIVSIGFASGNVGRSWEAFTQERCNMTLIPSNPYEFLSEEDIETGKLSD